MSTVRELMLAGAVAVALRAVAWIYGISFNELKTAAVAVGLLVIMGSFLPLQVEAMKDQRELDERKQGRRKGAD